MKFLRAVGDKKLQAALPQPNIYEKENNQRWEVGLYSEALLHGVAGPGFLSLAPALAMTL